MAAIRGNMAVLLAVVTVIAFAFMTCGTHVRLGWWENVRAAVARLDMLESRFGHADDQTRRQKSVTH